MKTAKEVLRAKNKENKVFGMIGGSSPLENSMVDAMKEYAREACKEQRTICAESGFNVANGEYTFEDIENAPEPEIK